MQSKIITISGTSGAGKSFLADKVIQVFPSITEIAGVTTRKMREGEIQGKSSHFITLEDFKKFEQEEQLILIKEFFGNKYAWFKSDLINDNKLKIMNISYKSIEELRGNGLDIFSIFIRPDSEETLKRMLKARCKSQTDYEKRIKDYYESEEFIFKHGNIFDLIFTNHYNEYSTNEFLCYICKKFMLEKQFDGENIDESINNLIEANIHIDNDLSKAEELLKIAKSKGEKNNGEQK